MTEKSVLVVEDDPLLRADASTLLREAGIDVIELETADEALAFTHDQPRRIAAIFTDVQMAGHLDGLLFAEIVSRHWPTIMVVVTSGQVRPVHPLPDNVRFLPKPWRPLEVLTMMQDAVAA